MDIHRRACPKCGGSVFRTDTTCMHCGAALDVPKRAAGRPATRSRRSWIRPLETSDKRALIWGGVVIFLVFELLGIAGSTSENANALWVVLSGLAWMVLLVLGIVFEVRQSQQVQAAEEAEWEAASGAEPELAKDEWTEDRRASELEQELKHRGLEPSTAGVGPDRHKHLAWFNSRARKAGVRERFVFGDSEKGPTESEGPNIGGAVVGGLVAGAPGMIVGGLSKKRHSSGLNSPIVKECPDCREHVKVRAKVCRFCSYRFQGDVDAWLAEFH